ncbi:MAG: hypothetical protein KC910_34495, partial [Candidatus Eremiobacteraeota bacterium]|nr:hypothetical protein [Candidatus Eremiobacteraeota bacterium]
LLIPDPGWAKAYQLAMGGTCRLTIVPVSPDWVTFDTAWQAGVECVWLTALEKPEELHLLCFQDFNRALPLLWARPITNLVRGYQSTLWAHGGLGWPANLRLLFTPATDAATLPIQEEFLNLLAAVPLSVLGGGEEQATTPPSPDDIISGHVEFSVWQVWASYFSVEGHGAARSQVLRSTAELLDESENRAERLAAKMTTVWPKEYGSLVGPR